MLNSYFSDCFNKSLPPLDVPSETMLSEVNPNTIEELLCTEEEVLQLLQTIDISKSSGPDRISGRMLKATAVSIAAPVAKLFIFGNISYQMDSVVPIPKSSDKGSPKNYRPISLLPILSKLLEKHVYGLLSKHLQLSEPIYSLVSNQRGKSTSTALLETTHNWLQLLESGRDVGAIFFNFKKAFDSVPHRALMDKLKGILYFCTGFRVTSLEGVNKS